MTDDLLSRRWHALNRWLAFLFCCVMIGVAWPPFSVQWWVGVAGWFFITAMLLVVWSRALPDGRSWHNRFGLNVGLLLCPGVNLVWLPVVAISVMVRIARTRGGNPWMPWLAAVGFPVMSAVLIAQLLGGSGSGWVHGWLIGYAIVIFGVVLPGARWAASRRFLPVRRERVKRFLVQLGLSAALCGFLPWSGIGLWWCYRQWRMLELRDVKTVQTQEVEK